MKQVKILANDGFDTAAVKMLEEAGIAVDTDTIPQEELVAKLNDYDGIIVRSATKVRKELIDTTPNLKFIGRAGVGMDNIDVDYARTNGKIVENTPAASSQSVAELVMAHLFSGARYLHDANRFMPQKGRDEFKTLKKKYAKGIELQGKTLGIIGFGRIGQATAKLALGLGMNVMYYNRSTAEIELTLTIAGQEIRVTLEKSEKEDVLKNSDFISMHIPHGANDKPSISDDEFALMKESVFIIQCGRGGSIDEEALMRALDSGKVAYAGLDVFENEPTPRKELLAYNNVSFSPHIGGSTVEAQQRIGIELAGKIIEFFKNN